MKEKLQKIDRKVLIMAGVFFIFVIVLIFGSAFIYNKFFYKRSYTDVESIMLNAAKSHFEEHPNMLPGNINDSVRISDSDLVKAEEMKPITDYLKDDSATCDGEVVVTNVNGNYRYAAFLDCGEDKHQTTKFINYINKKVSTVTSGNGLYELNDELVYRGDNVDNYITFSGNTYRIVKFTEDHPVLIYTEKMESVIWDDRYNIDKEDKSGINDYTVSRMRDRLNSLYESTELISEEDKLLVTAYDLEIGKRSSKDTDKTGYLEGSTILANQYIGLLTVSDFLNASLDENCNYTTSPSCSNYNYLSKYKYNWWTITASSENSHRVFRIGASSKAGVATASSNSYLRPVLHLAKDVIYVSGDGSKESPYVVK